METLNRLFFTRRPNRQRSNRAVLSPFRYQMIAPVAVCFMDSSNIWDLIWTTQKGADREQNFGCCQRWRAFRSENVQTNTAIGIYTRTINSRCERNPWRLQWIIGGKVNSQERAPLLGTGTRKPEASMDCHLSVVQIIAYGEGRWVGGGSTTALEDHHRDLQCHYSKL